MANAIKQDTMLARLIPLVLIFCVIHLYFLTNFTLSVDDEYAALREDSSVWIAQGRWTVYLIDRFILTQPTLVYLPGLLFGIGLALTFLLLIDAHRVVLGTFQTFLLFALFASFPTWFFIMEFYGNVPVVALGL